MKSTGRKAKGFGKYSSHLPWVYLIINDLIGTCHNGIKWIREEPRLKSIRSFKNWIITCCSIKYLTKANSNEIFGFHKQFESNASLNKHVLNSLKYFEDPFEKGRGAIGRPSHDYVSVPEILYMITRLTKPNAVVETGVASGVSSTYLLQALEDNKKGELYSIDISARIPRGEKPTGWIIPSRLRHRWNFILGKSSEKLLPLLEKLGEIDIFLHDSLHTYENMLWEYETTWPFIRKDGILLSHDVQQNYAFSDFCDKVKRKSIYIYYYLGGVKK